MSRVLKEIHAQSTGVRKAVMGPVQVTRHIADDLPVQGEYGQLYRIDVRLGREVLVRDPRTLPEIEKMVRKDLAEFVFGEFRERIREIEFAAYAGDAKKCSDEARAMYLAMFVDGI